MKFGWRIFSGVIFLLFAAQAFATTSVDARYEMIGILGGKSPVIVLKDKESKKVHYLRSGERIPGDSAIVKKIAEENQIVIVRTSGETKRLGIFTSKHQDQPDTLIPKKWAELKAYVLPYLKDENFIIDEDSSGRRQDLVGIPMGTADDVTEYVLLETIAD